MKLVFKNIFGNNAYAYHQRAEEARLLRKEVAPHLDFARKNCTDPECALNSSKGDSVRAFYYRSSYGKLDINELTLSYCSTVHASQGSEYKVVFVILDDTSVNDFLHIRRLLYTAVSRGKSKVYILTKPYLVDKCISNDSYRPRITKLVDFLMKG